MTTNLRIAAALSVVALGITACGTDAADNQAEDAPVQLTVWSFSPGMEERVAAFNDTHPDIEVTSEQVPHNEIYTKIFAAVEAGNAPDVAQVSVDRMTALVVEDALEDVSDDLASEESKYPEWVWNLNTFADKTYALSTDIGPLVLFYNKAAFDKHGLTVPSTWEQYRELGQQLRSKAPDVHLGSFFPVGEFFTGLSWAAGAEWFSTEGDAWRVAIDDPASTKVAEYWQGLINEKSVALMPMFSEEWLRALADEKVLSWVGASWSARHLIGLEAAPGTWAAAPLPQWEAGEHASASVGGSSYPVLKGTSHKEAAVEFTKWLASSEEALASAAEVSTLYPANTELAEVASEIVAENHPGFEGYFANDVYELYPEMTDGIQTQWMWGPIIPDVWANISESFSTAATDQQAFPAGLKDVQDQAVDLMQEMGLTVEASP